MSLNSNLRIKIYNKLNGKCAYCGNKIYFSEFHVDHVIPKSQEGSNQIENLMPSCPTCNLTKADLNIEEFRNKIFNLPDTDAFRLYRRYRNVKKITVRFYYEKLQKP